MRTSILTLALLTAGMLGCAPKSSPPPDKPVIEVNAPGVEVKVDPQEGTEVKAPGVEVEAPK
ncbi:MAG: hypothetical protein AB7O59_21820 [Pirellulales bacterium]